MDIFSHKHKMHFKYLGWVFEATFMNLIYKTLEKFICKSNSLLPDSP